MSPKQSNRISDDGLARIIDQVGKTSSNLGFVGGLNPAQWSALRYFRDTRGNRATVTAFAAFHGTTKGTASQTVAALVRKGLLKRDMAADDRRVHLLTLTEAGEAALADDPLNYLREALATLDDDEKWALAVGMEKILRSLIGSKIGSGG